MTHTRARTRGSAEALPYRFPDKILFVSDKVTPRLPVNADGAFFRVGAAAGGGRTGMRP